jgi:hypothetical protein
MADPASSIKIGLRRDIVVRSAKFGMESRPEEMSGLTEGNSLEFG